MFLKFRRKKEKSSAINDASEPQDRRKSSTSTAQSALSTFGIPSQSKDSVDPEYRLRERSRERRADPLGLHVLYEPDCSPTIDIIFVHGLGGTSCQSWSKNRDPKLFWPREWLPFEPEICNARILSFGYNAHFLSSSRDKIFNISDFAKDLLFWMKFGTDEKTKEFNVGNVPIIFVVHSMGGLVVKKAYILGQNDMHYKGIVREVCAILFLSTPHRGTNLAETLNRILSVSVFNHSPKQYIAEIQRNSPTLQEINEQFRNIAPSLQIVSFFETQETAIGPTKTLVLQKDSSVLGYSNEISKALDADHHGVCKYSSQQDPNYMSVRNLLKSLVSRFSAQRVRRQESKGFEQDERKLEALLGVSEAPDEDYEFYGERWMPGSCEWVRKKSTFNSWLDDTFSGLRILWLTGLPGTGKSIVSSYVIRHLKSLGLNCQFYFFRFGDKTKRSLNSLLRSIAYQVACNVPEYRRLLVRLSEDGLHLEKAEARLIWQRLFLSALFRLRLAGPLFWVIDALDESDSPQSVLNLLSGTSALDIPLRVMFVSRRLPALATSFGRIAESCQMDSISADDSVQDLRLYVTKELLDMRGSSSFKQYVIESILDVANGNFLWVYLVVKEILLCHTEAAIEQVLEELPVELEPLYKRMEVALTRTLRPGDKALAKTMLTWATCSQRPLTLQELSQALQPEHEPFLDLKVTINQVCGEFIVVDGKGRIAMVHHTAREYLTKTPDLDLFIDTSEAHRHLFSKCLSYLLDPHLRFRADQVESLPFLIYASTCWSYHLASSNAFTDQDCLLLLARFLRGPFVLTWIQVLASAGHLRVLVYAAKSLTSFLEKRSKIDAEQGPLTHRLQEKEVLELWAIDMVKIVGKFGAHLTSHPKCIYKLVPPFCPPDSIIYRQFVPKSNSGLSVTGFSSPSWDNCLAKFSVGRDCQALSIACLDRYFAALTSDGTVILWHATTCEEARRFPHGERVLAMRFSISGDLLVTSGVRMTKVWSVASAAQLHCFASPKTAKAISVVFASGDTTLFTCSDDRAIRSISLTESDGGWEVLEFNLTYDTFDGRYYNSPQCASFNSDGTQIAVSYRGFPLLVWGVDPPRLIGKCERLRDKNKSRNDLWSHADRIDWNPVTGHILGLYNDGCIFKWYPFESDNQELKTVASEVRCSPGGNIFVTSRVDGTLRIWNFHDFSLIYQLSCTSHVTDLAISPDGRRVYDLRDSICSVWEPNVLIRLSEADEKASEISSAMGSSTPLSLASEAAVEMLEPVTALTVGAKTSIYSIGNDEGVVKLFNKNGEELLELPSTFMTIDHIVWSEDERTLATGDLGGRICVRFLDMSPAPNVQLQTILEGRMEESIHQLLLSPLADFLLASIHNSATVWSLDKRSVVSTRTLPNTCRWVIHPHNKDLLLAFGVRSVQIYRWVDLAEVKAFQIDQMTYASENNQSESISTGKPAPASLSSPSDMNESVDDVHLALDGSHILLKISRTKVPSQGRPHQEFMVISASELDLTTSVDNGAVICPQSLPWDILDEIERPLGFLPGGVLAFLDKDFWVCSRPLSASRAGMKVSRHFFLPRDWLNAECLELSRVTKDGTFLCPRNGEVAVVRNGFRDEWIE